MSEKVQNWKTCPGRYRIKNSELKACPGRYRIKRHVLGRFRIKMWGIFRIKDLSGRFRIKNLLWEIEDNIIPGNIQCMDINRIQIYPGRYKINKSGKNKDNKHIPKIKLSKWKKNLEH